MQDFVHQPHHKQTKEHFESQPCHSIVACGSIQILRHGTFTIDSAQMLEEEEVEEIVKEKRELPPEPEPVEEVKDSKENSRDDFGRGMKEGMDEVIIDFMIYVL